MSLRLIEVILPNARMEDLRRALNNEDVLGLWMQAMHTDQTITRILVPTGHTEDIIDRLHERFRLDPAFRLMLFSVEATLPKPEPPAQDKEGQQENGTTSPQAASKSQRISREELYQDVAQGAQLTAIYLITVALSTVVAAVGVMRDDLAIIIGAMVIAPLLGPTVALALASALGDLTLSARSIKTLLAGIAIALLLSIFIGAVGPVDPQTPAIVSRTQMGVGDLLLALAAGSAGALAFTSGIPAGIIGVMVAVALLPPLVVVGLLVGAGYGLLGFNAMLLFVGNVACINLAGVVTFLSQKLQPRSWWAAERAGKATRIAVMLWTLTLAILLAIVVLTGGY